MKTSFVTSDVWAVLRKAAKSSARTAHVAVAYFGQNGATRLPLGEGSRIVVNASEAAVKSGQTCPAELKKLLKKGVSIYSVANLHAKVFVLGSKAYVGSANVSRYSDEWLIEAMVVTSDRAAVAEARRFVDSLCLHELGPEAIDDLAKIYRPPRMVGGRPTRRSSTRTGIAPELPRVLLAQLRVKDPPAGSENTLERGRKVAKERMKHPRRHELVDFWWRGKCPFRAGDLVVQVLKESNDRRMVTPPGTVLHVKKAPKCTFVYLELPRKRRVSLEILARRIGEGAEKRLGRGGQLSPRLAERLLAAWSGDRGGQ